MSTSFLGLSASNIPIFCWGSTLPHLLSVEGARKLSVIVVPQRVANGGAENLPLSHKTSMSFVSRIPKPVKPSTAFTTISVNTVCEEQVPTASCTTVKKGGEGGDDFNSAAALKMRILSAMSALNIQTETHRKIPLQAQNNRDVLLYADGTVAAVRPNTTSRDINPFVYADELPLKTGKSNVQKVLVMDPTIRTSIKPRIASFVLKLKAAEKNNVNVDAAPAESNVITAPAVAPILPRESNLVGESMTRKPKALAGTQKVPSQIPKSSAGVVSLPKGTDKKPEERKRYTSRIANQQSRKLSSATIKPVIPEEAVHTAHPLDRPASMMKIDFQNIPDMEIPLATYLREEALPNVNSQDVIREAWIRKYAGRIKGNAAIQEKRIARLLSREARMVKLGEKWVEL